MWKKKNPLNLRNLAAQEQLKFKMKYSENYSFFLKGKMRTKVSINNQSEVTVTNKGEKNILAKNFTTHC